MYSTPKVTVHVEPLKTKLKTKKCSVLRGTAFIAGMRQRSRITSLNVPRPRPLILL